MEGDFNKQNRQNDKDVIVSTLFKNYDASMSKDVASWHDNKWGKIVYLLNDGIKHEGIKNEILLRDTNKFHEQVLHEHEMNNNDDTSNRILTQDILKMKNSIRLVKELLLKQELQQQKRNMINESKLNECETHIGKMNSYLLQIEKEIDENKITGKNKVMKMVGYDDLKNENGDYEFTMKENVYKLNEMFQYITFVYNNCLKNVENKDLDKNSDIIDIFDRNESSLSFRKQSKQQENNNNRNSKINVKGYEMYSFGVFGDVHTNDYEAFANIKDNPNVKIYVQGWYDDYG